MKKMEFRVRQVGECLLSVFGAKERDVNKHHYLYGVEMPSIAERQGHGTKVLRQNGLTFSQWLEEDLRKQRYS